MIVHRESWDLNKAWRELSLSQAAYALLQSGKPITYVIKIFLLWKLVFPKFSVYRFYPGWRPKIITPEGERFEADVEPTPSAVVFAARRMFPDSNSAIDARAQSLMRRSLSHAMPFPPTHLSGFGNPSVIAGVLTHMLEVGTSRPLEDYYFRTDEKWGGHRTCFGIQGMQLRRTELHDRTASHMYVTLPIGIEPL